MSYKLKMGNFRHYLIWVSDRCDNPGYVRYEFKFDNGFVAIVEPSIMNKYRWLWCIGVFKYIDRDNYRERERFVDYLTDEDVRKVLSEIKGL